MEGYPKAMTLGALAGDLEINIQEAGYAKNDGEMAIWADMLNCVESLIDEHGESAYIVLTSATAPIADSPIFSTDSAEAALEIFERTKE